MNNNIKLPDISVSKLSIIIDVVRQICEEYNIKDKFSLRFGFAEKKTSESPVPAFVLIYDGTDLGGYELDDIYKYKKYFFRVFVSSLTNKGIINIVCDINKKENKNGTNKRTAK